MSAPIPPPNDSQKNETLHADWNAIAADPDFAALVRSKLKLVVPATIFFVIYYFLLPIGVGWFPDLMKKRVLGAVNLAYLFAFSQFFMAWALAFIYVAAAAGWDRRQSALLAKFGFHSKN
jgi:uncharacterized membrane protein (DUF485 family)